MNFFSTTKRDAWVCGLAMALLGWIGCETTGTGTSSAPHSASPTASAPRPAGAPPPSSNILGPSHQQEVLRAGDPITITFDGPIEKPPPVGDRVKADGMVSLPLLKDPIMVIGKTRSQLEEEIQKLYVPKLYRFLTVRITTEGRNFTVAGFVKSPGRYPYLGDTSLLKAIAIAGDFTDFSQRKKVRVTRANGQRITVNCEKAQHDSKFDIPIYPDDYIEVPRRWF